MAVVKPHDPESGFVPQTRLFGSTAAALRYNTVSHVVATLTARWLKIPFLGYYDDSGTVAAE